MQIFVEQKTLIAVRQLDRKRKTHLIKFLYAADMIRHDQAHIRLADAELEQIDLSEMNFVEGKQRSHLFELAFKQTFLNHATFTHRTIVNSNFDGASLIEANFRGCRITSTSFVGAILRYADFRNVTSRDSMNFKSADLFGAQISDELLLKAISIEDAILPNGTRGIQPNLLINGNAERTDCTTNTSIPTPWYVKQISGNVSLNVISYQNYESIIDFINSNKSRGKCFYAARGREGKVMMRQEIPSDSIAHMPIKQENVFLLLKLFCAPIKIMNEIQGFTNVHLEQFDKNGRSLRNYSRGRSWISKFIFVFIF